MTVAIHPIDILKYKIPFEFGSTVGWGSEEVINVTDTIQLNNSMMSQRIKRINLRILTDFECENLYFERIIGIYHICGLGEKKDEQIAVVIDFVKLFNFHVCLYISPNFRHLFIHFTGRCW